MYEVSKELYRVNYVLEKHLGKCTNDLFDMDDKVIIYDLTNTFRIAIGIEDNCEGACWFRLRRETQQREAQCKTNCAGGGGKY